MRALAAIFFFVRFCFRVISLQRVCAFVSATLPVLLLQQVIALNLIVCTVGETSCSGGFC